MKEPIPNDRDPISIWRIFLPPDIDRDVYIKDCVLSGTVSIVDQFNEIQHRVKVGKLALSLIVFPETTDDLGSEVACVSAPYGGQLYVVEVYSKPGEFTDQTEESFRVVKSLSGGIAELLLDGRGKILLKVDSEQASGVDIHITDKNKGGKLSITVNGEVTLHNQGKTLIKASEQILLESDQILLNQGEEPVLLGNATVELIDNLLELLSQDSAGPYSLRNNSKYQSLRDDLDALKSKLTFVK